MLKTKAEEVFRILIRLENPYEITVIAPTKTATDRETSLLMLKAAEKAIEEKIPTSRLAKILKVIFSKQKLPKVNLVNQWFTSGR